ncbi:TPA: helicase, partial [bacterium]|nr:helicase [bacterium]
NNKYLLINDSNSNKFFGLIYPKIKDGIKIENEEELSKLNKIKDLKIKVYLDIKDGILYLDYKFFYGDLTKEEALVNNEFINEEVEDNFIDFIYELGFDKENLTIENDELIYDFLTNQIENLKQYAEVYISESIKNINIRQMKQPSVGVRFDNNLLEVSFDNLDFDVKELEKVLRTYQLKRKFYRLKDGSVIVLKNEYMDLLNETYEALNVKANQLSDINYVESYKAMKFSNILEHIDEDVNLKEFIDSLVNYEKADYPLDEHFNQVLRSYQKIGYKWLVNLTKYRLGGILADEMGLGKTIQIIALLENDQEDMPSLIVTPASLIYNWEYEFKQFSPSSNVLVIDGNVSERKEAIKNINGKQFIITSYDYLKRDIEYYNNLQFRFCIIDEAQNIKNQTTKNAKSVKSIDAQVRFALTGTPIENALSDLWSIFDFILPGYFRTYERFKREYEIDIVKNDDEHKLKKLSMQISPFILRRTKKEVLSELPPKVEQVIYAKMDEEQKRIYQAMLLNIKRKIINPETNKFEVLSYLTRLRQVCCDPNLIIDSYIGESPKLELTASLVEESINAGHKILIFSQFTSMLDLIAQKLDSIKIPYLTLIGETPKKERLDLVNKFNSSVKFNVFLISLKAGGLGLNLTSADTIIHYDPWWNVSAENQASDRAHRIGQTKTVQVMKLIMKDSIEEKIIKLQELKQQLVDNVINDEEKLISKLTYAEILSLFE